MAKVLLSAEARQAIYADMLERPHIEACGLLIGEMSAAGDWVAQQALPLCNARNSAVRFEFESEELLAHDLAYGERIVGVYHSHPAGPPAPSAIDTANMENMQQSPWVWLIASFGGYRPFRGKPNGGDLLLAAFRHDPTLGLQTLALYVVPAQEADNAPAEASPQNGQSDIPE
jgi:proteasome lid subunit RPN8/RPN11